MKTKVCQQCGRERIILLFYHDRSSKDGRAARCKACMRARVKSWQAENLGLRVGKLPGLDPLEIRRVRDKILRGIR